MNEEISYLFVPANKKVMISKALTYGANAIILDLEDAVHPDEKPLGRDNIQNWLTTINNTIINTSIYIRINHPKEKEFKNDVDLLNSLNETLMTGVMIPKLEDAEILSYIKSKLHLAISKRPFIGIIETARGVHHCEEIANSGVTRLAFGSLDYSLDIDCQQTA